MEYSIHEVARIAGTTSRTLRHYDAVGLLAPSRIGDNGYRYYDRDALVRLQRILLLRGLGLGLPAIAEVFAQQTDAASALETHVGWLKSERERLGRQLRAVETTLAALRNGGDLTMETMFDGFDPTRYKDEVEQRWGKEAYAESAAWWESKSAAERAAFEEELQRLNRDWIALAASGAEPEGEAAQALAERHVAWLKSIPGTPAAKGDRAGLKAYVTGLAGMYVADPRFAANYGGAEGAAVVRAALERYAETRL